MWEDPIVAEVHRTRQKLAAECNFDIGVFFANLRNRQKTHKKQAELTPDAGQGQQVDSDDARPSKTAPAA